MISDEIGLNTVGYQLAVDDVLGTARLQVTPIEATGDVFVGIARSEDVASYLRGSLTGRSVAWVGTTRTWARWGQA